MSIESGPGELPLCGILVAEFCNVAAGPFCAMLLADMGADIIKIEPKDGDMLRHWPPHTDGFSDNFASFEDVADIQVPRDDASVEAEGEADLILDQSRNSWVGSRAGYCQGDVDCRRTHEANLENRLLLSRVCLA